MLCKICKTNQATTTDCRCNDCSGKPEYFGFKIETREWLKENDKIYILEENTCELNCDCGWNLRISGKDRNDLKKIKDYLKNTK